MLITLGVKLIFYYNRKNNTFNGNLSLLYYIINVKYLYILQNIYETGSPPYGSLPYLLT